MYRVLVVLGVRGGDDFGDSPEHLRGRFDGMAIAVVAEIPPAKYCEGILRQVDFVVRVRRLTRSDSSREGIGGIRHLYPWLDFELKL